ncbi:MAG: MFS transporter [Gammaproteobacteria bacterium]|nr:MFS transporter [Gammaproteobacteria bacterium]
MSDAVAVSRQDWRPMIAVGVGCLFFGYGFLIRVSPSVMVAELMREFGVGAAILGNLSAVYLYVYALLQIPIGVLMDRVGPRRLMSAAAVVVGVGVLMFAVSDTVNGAYAGRFLIGAGCAFTWPGLLALIHHWFPMRFALLAGVGQVTGMVGAVFGQAPLAAAVEAHGWRGTMIALAGIGVVMAILIWMTARDRRHPDSHAMTTKAALRQVASNKQTWLSAIFGLAMTGPLLAFGGLWGVPFLSTVYGLDRPAAAGIVSLIFIGSGAGAVILGGWSDRIGKRKPVMLIAGVLCTAALFAVIHLPELPVFALSVLIFAMGFGGASLLLAFATGREHNTPGTAGTAIGIVNTAVVGSGALFQPIIGIVLDLNWSGELAEGVRVYAPETFRLALTVLPVCGILGLLAAMFSKETFCRQRT